MMDGTLVEAQNALRLFGAWFGKPPYPRIAITQQPEFNFGQSWPTLVYLPMSAYLDSTQRWQLMGRIQNRLTEFVDEVTAHEVSHQWWGDEVGWSTYHDQWLSEGLAFFSAALYWQATEKNSQKYIDYWEHARQMLLEKNRYGRRANDAGPVWMGLRLATPKTAQGYSAVVYRKGGYVLNMLRALMYDSQEPEKPFMHMLHDFVEEYRNRTRPPRASRAWWTSTRGRR
jgi:aminopeptidase N